MGIPGGIWATEGDPREAAQKLLSNRLERGDDSNLHGAILLLVGALNNNTAALRDDIASRERLEAALKNNAESSEDLTRAIRFWTSLDDQGVRSPLED